MLLKVTHLKISQKTDLVCEAKYNKAAEVEPDSAVVHFNKGNALYKQGEYAGALEYIPSVQISKAGFPKGAARDVPAGQPTHCDSSNRPVGCTM